MSDPLIPPIPLTDAEIPNANPLSGTLADPWIRFAATLIDFVILLPVRLILLLLVPGHGAFSVLIASLLSVVALIAINWKFLPKGQTIGKLLLKLQIQGRDGSLLPVETLITKRILPLYVAACIPFIGAVLVIADALCIFRAGHNTLHDDIAGSKVVRL